MDEITGLMTQFAVQTNFDDLPDDASFYVKRGILDLIGCACAGTLTDRGRIAVDVAAKLGGAQDATIIATPHKLSSTNAAFANGELMNALDYDAMTDIGKHDVPIIVAAALAIAESIGSAGKDLITAITIGLEVSTRLSSGKDRIQVATENPPPVMGSSSASIAAAIAAGRLLGLDSETMTNAIGISGFLCPPSTFKKWLETRPVRMIKYGSTGWGAQAGVTAALLAHSGYTGDTDVFDGEYGFWRFTGRSEAIAKEAFADLGDKWLWRKINFKRYPSGGVLSGVLNQFIHLIKTNHIKPDDISRITAYAPPIVGFKLFRENELETPDDYCFNVRYLLSCAAHGIDFAYWQRAETRRDKRIIDFMGSVDIDVITDEQPAEPLEVVAKGKRYLGDAKSSRKPEPEDGTAYDEMVIGKFRSNVSSFMSSQDADKIIEEVLSLDEVDTITSVMDLVRI